MKLLVTGSAGFIGASLVSKLVMSDIQVIGVDNHNDYYDKSLKEDRCKLNILNKNYKHFKLDIKNLNKLREIFENETPSHVIHLAAQAGVRYSIKNPLSYVENNILGFYNILEMCRHNKIKHLVYASSSSVYGANTSIPFSVSQNVDHPLSFYAATKKANELMAHSYSHLFGLPTTGLRFFTVYGPWDRPDMALQKFAHAIMNNQSIDIYNNGNHSRDFTYIDDIVEGIFKIIQKPAKSNKKWSGDSPDPSSSRAPWRIYNIGNNKPVNLMKYIELLEEYLEKKAKKKFLPIQPGDVPDTYADISNLIEDYNYKPKTTVENGVLKFSEWFKKYYRY
jgi:UDP-glucuronate 4-epimerase